MRQVEAVPVLGPAAHQDADGGAGSGQRDQYRVRRALREDRLRNHADRLREAGRRFRQRGLEQRLVLLGRLVLDRQGLRVVGSAALHRLLAFLRRRLQGDVREVLEEPADLVRGVRGEGGASEGGLQHGPSRQVGGDHGEDHLRGVSGELGQQAVGGVELGGVRGGVDDHEDGVEVGAGDVVDVPVAWAVRRVVVGGEGQAGSYRVSGVVHGQDRGAGGCGVADLCVGYVLQLVGEAEGGVHQLFEAEYVDAAGIERECLCEAGGHLRECGVQTYSVCGGEAVTATVGEVHRPVQVDSGDVRLRAGGG
ncbi:hypothetical protein IQ63_30350 [Streptomyces acidiscabies]|uniref:Uncharacterized protein n=1 Tax=Streptomyces acidiscabies TaxID=42234 RepID=A0A0L0JWW2_9ACTN|nr:hypothetical protein IQ63_30350 [Streptomyces acidiscabies]